MSRTGILWVTFHPSDIAKARQFMDNLAGETTIDVLGISRSMEAISDILFPATSTLHKRIRYQLFVPSILLNIYRHPKPVNAEERLRSLEYQLQQTLIKSGETYSVFGSTRGEALKYWPSMIYWSSLNALRLWGEEYLGRYQALEIIDERHNAKGRNDEGELDDEQRDIEPTEGLMKIHEKIFPKGIMAKTLTFDLEHHEAVFLKNRFISLFPNSMTTYLLKYGSSKHCGGNVFSIKCPKHPALNNLLTQAEKYSRAAMGATYAYRWALSRARTFKDGERNNQEHFTKWLSCNQKKVQDWRFTDLIRACESVGSPIEDDGETKFINDFLKIACNGKPSLKKLDSLDPIMRKREEQIKGRNRTHFNNTELQVSQVSLGERPYSDHYYYYRWEQGSVNLKDIFAGLRRK